MDEAECEVHVPVDTTDRLGVSCMLQMFARTRDQLFLSNWLTFVRHD
jgi:hypothetical protein